MVAAGNYLRNDSGCCACTCLIGRDGIVQYSPTLQLEMILHSDPKKLPLSFGHYAYYT
jgi:hypothetical protein